MKLLLPENIPEAEIGYAIADCLMSDNDFVHVENLAPLVTMGEVQRDNYIREVAASIGQLTLNGATGSELWHLHSFSSPKALHVPFHMDNPFYRQPEKIVSFWSIRTSENGGENIILPVSDLIDWLSTQPQHAETFEELTTSVVSFSYGNAHADGTLLEPETTSARYDQKYLGSEYASLGSRFTQILDEAKILSQEVRLKPGEALFFNNPETLHARAPYTDSDRLSIRVRIQDIL